MDHKVLTITPGSVVIICPKLGHTSAVYTSSGILCACGKHIRH